MMIELTHDPISLDSVVAAVRSTNAGAVLLFLGTTREFTGGERTTTLIYEAYRPMAEQQLRSLAEQASSRWSLTGCAIVHRLGEVPLGEASVAVAVSSPHRTEAFAAGRWLIDTLKQDVPIWKQDVTPSGQTAWVHPGLSKSGNSTHE